MGDAVDRRRAELSSKLEGLGREFQAWLDLTDAGGPLPTHYSQIRAVLESLAGPMAAIGQRAADRPEDWVRTEGMLLGLHALWDFFREKFLQRYAPTLAEYLALAEEFAWACYEPAQRAAAGAARREPPLTFLGALEAPAAARRGAAYDRHIWPDGASVEMLRDAARRLPVPVIGLPWFQVRHLPDAVIVGHEVGHHVETDFALTSTLNRLVHSALSGEDRLTWKRWLGEVFADVYGALAAGPAYGWALVDFGDTGAVDPAYPPAAVRVHIVVQTLREQRLDADADLLAAAVPTPTEPLRSAAREVVAALVAGPYPELKVETLTDVLSFRTLQDSAVNTADALLQRVGPQPTEIRVLTAATVLAFHRDPAKYRREGVTDAVLAEAKAILTAGVRDSPAGGDATDRNEEAGREIIRLLGGI